MKLYQLYVPIPNYNNDGIFFQEMFIISDKVPTSTKWLSVAESYHNRDEKYPEYTNDWANVCNAIGLALQMGEFPSLYGNCVHKNGFIPTEFGKQPITLRMPYVELALG